MTKATLIEVVLDQLDYGLFVSVCAAPLEGLAARLARNSQSFRNSARAESILIVVCFTRIGV